MSQENHIFCCRSPPLVRGCMRGCVHMCAHVRVHVSSLEPLSGFSESKPVLCSLPSSLPCAFFIASAMGGSFPVSYDVVQNPDLQRYMIQMIWIKKKTVKQAVLVFHTKESFCQQVWKKWFICHSHFNSYSSVPCSGMQF